MYIHMCVCISIYMHMPTTSTTMPVHMIWIHIARRLEVKLYTRRIYSILSMSINNYECEYIYIYMQIAFVPANESLHTQNLTNEPENSVSHGRRGRQAATATWPWVSWCLRTPPPQSCPVHRCDRHGPSGSAATEHPRAHGLPSSSPRNLGSAICSQAVDDGSG